MDILEYFDPLCHNTGHQVGRAASRMSDDIEQLIGACGARCHNGCFHGVVLGVVVDTFEGPEDDEERMRVLTNPRMLSSQQGVLLACRKRRTPTNA